MDSTPPEEPRPILPDMLTARGVSRTLKTFLSFIPEEEKETGYSDIVGYLRLVRAQSQFSGIVSGAELDINTDVQFKDTGVRTLLLEVQGHILMNHPVHISKELIQELGSYLHAGPYKINEELDPGKIQGARILTVPNPDSRSHITIAFAPEGEMDDALSVHLYPREGNVFRFPAFENQQKLIYDISQSVPSTVTTLARAMAWLNSQIGGVFHQGIGFEKPTPFAWEGYDYVWPPHKEHGGPIFNKARFPAERLGHLTSWEHGPR